MRADRAPLLVLWDIDRTLVYVGHTDRLVYRQAFTALVGRPPATLPAKGTGRTVPLAIEELLRANGVDEHRLPALAQQMMLDVPCRQAAHREHMLATGELLPGAREALVAVHGLGHVIATVVTGNLQASAEAKLALFDLQGYLDTSIGGYSSDDPHRPNLVAVAQRRAQDRHGYVFDRTNTVIIGDSLEDVSTGREGGAQVIAVASGTTPAAELARAGADVVLADLRDHKALLTALAALSPDWK